ncbi:MAG: transposase [Thermomicrobiales bacterium]|nr:transposase [Thermomicrobiales bacterium]
MSDGREREAIGRHVQGTNSQRCQVHVTRNLLTTVSRTQRRAVADNLPASVPRGREA